VYCGVHHWLSLRLRLRLRLRRISRIYDGAGAAFASLSGDIPQTLYRAIPRHQRASRVTLVTSRSRSIFVSTFESCWSEFTLKVAVIAAVPSG
jgi:hypothetical protein